MVNKLYTALQSATSNFDYPLFSWQEWLILVKCGMRTPMCR